MKTLTTGVAALVLVGAAYAAVTVTGKEPGERKASISCYWTPSEREGTLAWKFGDKSGSGTTSGPTRSAPFLRTGKVKVGEPVILHLDFLGGGFLTGRGLFRSCTVKAGANVETRKATNHMHLDMTVTAV